MTTSLLSTATGDFRIDLQGPADAPVLMLSNSLGTTLEMWTRRLPPCAANFVCCATTRAAMAPASASGPYSVEQLGRDVLAILDALQVQQAHFCGISMGGLTGLWLGVNAGQRLRSLTVANSAAKIGVESAWLERAAQVRANGAAGMLAWPNHRPAAGSRPALRLPSPPWCNAPRAGSQVSRPAMPAAAKPWPAKTCALRLPASPPHRWWPAHRTP
jgi:3-oxoadipate enol-lactonase